MLLHYSLLLYVNSYIVKTTTYFISKHTDMQYAYMVKIINQISNVPYYMLVNK